MKENDKNKINKDIPINFIQDYYITQPQQYTSPRNRKKISTKRIILDCSSSKNEKNQIQSNTKAKKETVDKKNFSSLTSKNLYTKLGNKIQDKKSEKIVINCDDKKQNNKSKKIANERIIPQFKLLPDWSAKKNKESSPNEIRLKTEGKNDSTNEKNIPKARKSLNTKNCVKLKKENNGITLNLNKNDSDEKNDLKSESKGKDNSTKTREKLDKLKSGNTVIPSQLNHFLNNNNSKTNTLSEKKVNIYNSVCQNKVGPLKLFDCEESSSSFEESEEEEDNKDSDSQKEDKESRNEENEEKEFPIDSKFKISEGEISDELNGSNKDRKRPGKMSKTSKNIIPKNLGTNENKINENNRNRIYNQIDEGGENIATNFYLNPEYNKNGNKSLIISSLATKPGILDNLEKTNQDSHLILENLFSQNLNIYGIFDGHGDNGHLISSYISKFMNTFYNNKNNYYVKQDDKENALNKNITNIFFENHKNIIQNCSSLMDEEIKTKIDFDISLSGSTSIMVFLTNDNLICSNVGDSQCFLFNCSADDLWTFESLAKQHLATNDEEKKRIVESGGDIHPYYEEDGIFEGPDRIYAKNKAYPGLVMSRTIGDLEAKKIGVISEPEFITKKIDKNCKYLVIGSDGLWDVVKPYDIIRIVRPFFNRGDIEGACQILLKKAVQQWDKGKEERDDITIIVIFIGIPNNALINSKNSFLKKIDEIENDEFSSNKLIKLNL